jgi:gas vesicle structural protein
MGERAGSGGLIDVLDRVLDKGIVIDAHVRVGIVGVELIAVEARVVVASIETYLAHAEAISYTAPAARPQLPATPPALPPGAVPPLTVETVAEPTPAAGETPPLTVETVAETPTPEAGPRVLSLEPEATAADGESPPEADDELPAD